MSFRKERLVRVKGEVRVKVEVGQVCVWGGLRLWGRGKMRVGASNAPPHEHVSLEGVRDDVGLPGVRVPCIVAVDEEDVRILRHLVFRRRLERGEGDRPRRVERAPYYLLN